MRIDRLFSLVVLLLDKSIVSSRELARRFEISSRTIQRDMDSLSRAGIPIYSLPGPAGGYGIMDSFKLDHRLMTQADFLTILTALKGVESSFGDRRFQGTFEKIQSVIPTSSKALFAQREEKMVLDFSLIGGNEEARKKLRTIEECIDSTRKVRFFYTNHTYESVYRTVEPMTLVFQWRSWYLFGFCCLKLDYRLFRLGRMRDIESTDEHFARRSKSFRAFSLENPTFNHPNLVEVTLRFHPSVKPMLEEFYAPHERQEDAEGYTTVRFTQPEEQRLYGYILSFGEHVEVLSPHRLREIIRLRAQKIAGIYTASHNDDT